MSVKSEKKYVPVLHTSVQLKPAEGKSVRMESGKYLPKDGDTVTYTAYWARRLDDEDIVIIGPGEVDPIEETKPALDKKSGN